MLLARRADRGACDRAVSLLAPLVADARRALVSSAAEPRVQRGDARLYRQIRLLAAPHALAQLRHPRLAVARARPATASPAARAQRHQHRVCVVLVRPAASAGALPASAWASVCGGSGRIAARPCDRRPRSAATIRARASRGSSTRSAFRRMIAVNRDIMIRSFALLVAFAFFTRAGRAMRRRDAGGQRDPDATSSSFAAYFLDGLATAAEQFAGRAVGARQRRLRPGDAADHRLGLSACAAPRAWCSSGRPGRSLIGHDDERSVQADGRRSPAVGGPRAR